MNSKNAVFFYCSRLYPALAKHASHETIRDSLWPILELGPEASDSQKEMNEKMLEATEIKVQGLEERLVASKFGGTVFN